MPVTREIQVTAAYEDGVEQVLVLRNLGYEAGSIPAAPGQLSPACIGI